MARYDAGKCSVEVVLKALRKYAEIHDPGGKDRSDGYRRTLVDKPWQSCKCDVCADLGHHVVISRGAERNRRRAFGFALRHEK